MSRRSALRLVDSLDEREDLISADKTIDASIHWAQERTFIAWMRTSTSALGFGLVLVKISKAQGGEVISAVMFILMGLLFFIGVCVRFFFLYPVIERGLFYPNKMWPTISAVLCIGCTCVIMVSLASDRR